ncbi:MAG TPA: translocation/assembly module TamB domain-containing protein [Acidobacteriaceae bacterium]|jgi:translocation and assembly module TamB|nr:translocation/assembly module TamB domain-containing protein [Acidobacteriaceae bacterium]
MSITPMPEPEQTPRPRRRLARLVLLLFLWGLGLLVILAIGLTWYASTQSFENRVRRQVIAQVENATGGRVELQHFGWRFTHLEFEADNLTIHGLEAPGQIPYAHLDRLFVRLQIISFFRPKVSLNYLEADHPVLHLIVYPDGTTNQPQPKHPSSGSTKDQIFDLAIGRTILSNGLAIVNQRAIPFNLTASNLGAQVSYVPATGRYVGTLHIEDISAQRGLETPVHSTLDASLDLGRDAARLVSLTLQSGPQGKNKKTIVRVAGGLTNFADPHFQFTMKGAIDALEVRAFIGDPGIAGGTAQLNLTGRGTLPRFNIDGTVAVTGGVYSIGTVNATGAAASANVHVTQDLVALTGIHALAAGGVVDGYLNLVNWQAPAPPPGRSASPKGPVRRGIIRTHVSGFSLDRILDVVAPDGYRRFGFDTIASGTADVDWTGSANDLVGAADVTLAPAPNPISGEVPVTGVVHAKYVHHIGSVAIGSLDVRTPASVIHIGGTLGVYPLSRPTSLTATLVTRNVAEFNPALAVFGISAPGQPTPIPAALHGEAQFNGDVTGTLLNPDFHGHLQASNFDVTPRALTPAATEAIRNIHFDTLVADADYSAGSLGVTAATLVQGKTTIQFSGQVHGDPKAPTELFAETSAIQASVQVRNADLAQWIALTGKSYPVSGTVNLHAQTTGTIGNLDGSGQISLAVGSIANEPYHSLTSNIAFKGKNLSASDLVFSLDGGHITGDGSYNFGDQSIQFDARGSGFELAHIRRIQNDQYPVTGSFAFDARGGGTLASPTLEASLHIAKLTLARESTGDVDAEAHTEGRTLRLHVAGHLNTASLDMNAETELSGDYPTHATLTVAKFNIDPLLRTFSVTGVRGSSSIAAAVTVSGPLRYPKKLSGDAHISELSVTLEDVPIHSDGMLHATLAGGVLHLDPVHIMGPDTDLHAQGTLGVFDNPRPIQATASGSVNMSLAETLDTDIVSSGHVDFTLHAQGTTLKPDLTGNVKFTNVNLALEDYINGLSRMNGELVFDQDRLDFKNVTAYSGGGLIKVGGFVTYHRGLYADLTAQARGVRIRYPQGVTSTADADLRFQGTRTSMLFSGDVTVTAFSVSQDVDFAAVAASGNGVTLPPDPNAPANRVRLDIRVNSAPSLDFQNSFARLAGNVDLVVRGTLAQPTILGRVTVTEGSATFNGEKFQLQHGEIYFSNPVRIQPTVDITATTTVEDYNITIGLQGTTANLSPTFRSEPPLSEQDIFSLLAMGRTQEEQQIYSTEEQQAGVNSTADSLLGGALNATISSRIQKLFGGGSVRIDPTFISGVGNATARITVEEPISKQATLTYATNVNSTAEQLIQGEWHLTQDFSILAVRDESGVFSLLFRLHRRNH